MESVTIQAKANEIFVRDEKDPSKITSRITVEEGKYKGIRKYGLMELGGSFKVIVSSPDSTLSLKNVPENTSPNSDGSYTLVPFVLSANGALEIGAAFSFTFKDGLPVTDDGGDKILKMYSLKITLSTRTFQQWPERPLNQNLKALTQALLMVPLS